MTEISWNNSGAPAAPPTGDRPPRWPSGDQRSGPSSPPLARPGTSRPFATTAPTAPRSAPADPVPLTQHMFLPPVAPPGVRVSEAVPAAPPDPPTRWGWRALVAFLGGGLLAAAGFAAAQEFDDAPEVAATPITVQVAPDTTTPPVIVQPPDLDTTEPVTFVAQVLGPSIVQVEIPNVGLGSGVVFDDGLIMTNHHVIAGAERVEIRTADGRLLAGEVLGSDPRTDIAVVSVGPGSGIPVAQLALGVELEVGQTTIAIGSPFQLQQTVTSGIISSLNRPVPNGAGYNPMIQTDAAINTGNSGGALANRNGQVIGINTAIQTDGLSTGNLGVGFAVPIDTAKDIADRILAGDPLDPGFLGVAGGPTEDGSSGVLVESLTAGSAAELGGIEPGDRIVSIDGAPVTSIEELAGLVQTKFPGDEVSIELFRNGERQTLTAVLGQR